MTHPQPHQLLIDACKYGSDEDVLSLLRAPRARYMTTRAALCRFRRLDETLPRARCVKKGDDVSDAPGWQEECHSDEVLADDQRFLTPRRFVSQSVVDAYNTRRMAKIRNVVRYECSLPMVTAALCLAACYNRRGVCEILHAHAADPYMAGPGTFMGVPFSAVAYAMSYGNVALVDLFDGHAHDGLDIYGKREEVPEVFVRPGLRDLYRRVCISPEARDDPGVLFAYAVNNAVLAKNRRRVCAELFEGTGVVDFALLSLRGADVSEANVDALLAMHPCPELQWIKEQM